MYEGKRGVCMRGRGVCVEGCVCEGKRGVCVRGGGGGDREEGCVMGRRGVCMRVGGCGGGEEGCVMGRRVWGGETN